MLYVWVEYLKNELLYKFFIILCNAVAGSEDLGSSQGIPSKPSDGVFLLHRFFPGSTHVQYRADKIVTLPLTQYVRQKSVGADYLVNPRPAETVIQLDKPVRIAEEERKGGMKKGSVVTNPFLNLIGQKPTTQSESLVSPE